MTEASLLPEVIKDSEKIEYQTGKRTLTCQEAAKYCQCSVRRIYSAINKGKLKAEGGYNKRITPIALASWLHGQNA